MAGELAGTDRLVGDLATEGVSAGWCGQLGSMHERLVLHVNLESGRVVGGSAASDSEIVEVNRREIGGFHVER